MKQNIIVGAVALLLGLVIGGSLSGGSYQKGRLSACNDITGMLNQSMPMQLECVAEKGDVFITSPFFNGKKVTLDGKLAN
jgi:hypothetical protein